MNKQHDLLIIGDSAFAEVAFEYFTHDSPYTVRGFAVERAYRQRDSFHGLPVVDAEDAEQQFPPGTHHFFAALVYTKLNQLRARFYEQFKRRGYAAASYISSRAFVWPNVECGEHCFVFEDNTVQPYARLGNNVVLWSGNHIGHHSSIGDHCFVSSHVVVSGFCEIGQRCFFGVNAALGNNLQVGDDCFVGAGALVTRSIPADTIVKGRFSETALGALGRFAPEEPA